MGLKNRTVNRPLIMLARCFLNPGRSFANLMAFKQPWNCDTRMDIFGENFVKRHGMLADYKYNGGPKPVEFVHRPNDSSHIDPNHIYPKAAPMELSAYPNYEHGTRNCIGGGGSGAVRLSDL